MATDLLGLRVHNVGQVIIDSRRDDLIGTHRRITVHGSNLDMRMTFESANLQVGHHVTQESIRRATERVSHGGQME